jgi:hypothetical protein
MSNIIYFHFDGNLIAGDLSLSSKHVQGEPSLSQRQTRGDFVDFSFPHNKVLVSLAACSVLRRFALSIISLRSRFLFC